MIRVNLLSEKRKKPIIPVASLFPIIIVLIGLACIGAGWFFGNQFLSTYNDDLKEKKEEIESQISKEQTQVTKRDKLKKECNKMDSEIRRLNQLSGANLVQWSQTFTELTSVVPEKTVWITNFRVDSDRRVQITAYSCAEESKNGNKDNEAKLTLGIQKFVNTLMQNPLFSEIFLTSATKNIYEKMPVWRFEINCRLARDLATQ